MRTATDIKYVISISGEVVETPILYNDNDRNSINYKAFKKLLLNIKDYGIKISESDWHNPMFFDVPKSIISEFIRSYSSHFLNYTFQTTFLADFISNLSEKDSWDIVFIQGDGGSIPLDDIFNINVRKVQRNFILKRDEKVIQLSGNSSRLGSASATREGLSKREAKAIETEYKRLNDGKGINQNIFLRNCQNRKPLLMIYTVDLHNTNSDLMDKLDTFTDPIIGLGLGFPIINGLDKEKYIEYKVNLVEWKNLFDMYEDDENEE